MLQRFRVFTAICKLNNHVVLLQQRVQCACAGAHNDPRNWQHSVSMYPLNQYVFSCSFIITFITTLHSQNATDFINSLRPSDAYMRR